MHEFGSPSMAPFTSQNGNWASAHTPSAHVALGLAFVQPARQQAETNKNPQPHPALLRIVNG